MREVRSIRSDRLSLYRSEHEFAHYGVIDDVADLEFFTAWARERGRKIYFVGNGSNTLFVRRRVQTLILKNNLKPVIEDLGKGRFRVSSSVMTINLLKYCLKRRLESFYYLASVPATIGGALAMNAGRGREYNLTIYDFVESVTFWDDGEMRTLRNKEIKRSYRQTMFTGVHSRLITEGTFRFPSRPEESNPIRDRILWSNEHQDNNKPNCVSVFKTFDLGIMRRLRGKGILGARYSPKTVNWLFNESHSTMGLRMLILLARLLHRLRHRLLEIEIIEVD